VLAEKSRLRSAEIEAAERHLERLREGRPETLETTSLHLDILRDLKRIHSHICAAAYAAINSTAGAPTDEATDSGPITLSTSRYGPGVE
jgi:phosphate:Na+ symporter